MRNSFILFAFLLSACQFPVVTSEPDFFQYRNQRVALITFKAADRIPNTTWEAMRQQTLQAFQAHPEVAAAYFASEVNASSPNFPNRLRRFRTTFALTGIVEKDLAEPLRADLNADLLFLLQLEEYPCTEDCPSDRQFLLRLKLVDFRDGRTLYQARFNYQLDEDEREPEALAALVAEWNQRMLNRWNADFRTPWHRWRYENLKPLALQTDAAPNR
jgi:hypothetical protein